ncbi:MAG: GNAT family N-acetyltransferase [Anaerolineae bacterium]|nr:GNAT family N-acetyltransferase [Anaerolineae bacterium]
MPAPYTLTLTDAPRDEDRRLVQQGLRAFNDAHVGDDGYQPLCIFLRDESGGVLGGLLGETYWGWLSIGIVWLREDARGGGYGKQILFMAEHEAIRRGCHHAHVDTMAFQAPDFYLKLGYVIWGQLDDLPLGNTRYFLKKDLRSKQLEPDSAS